DGSVRWVRSRGTATRNEEGRPMSLAGSHEDITDSKEREQFYVQVLDSFPGLVWVKNRDLRFEFVNKGLADAFGHSKEEVLGKRDDNFNPMEEEVSRFWKDDRRVLDTNQPLEISEEVLTDSQGKKRVLATKKIPLRPPLRWRDREPLLLGF